MSEAKRRRQAMKALRPATPSPTTKLVTLQDIHDAATFAGSPEIH